MSVFVASTKTGSGSAGMAGHGTAAAGPRAVDVDPRRARRWVAAWAAVAVGWVSIAQAPVALAVGDPGWVAYVDTNDLTPGTTDPNALALTAPTGSGTLKRISDGSEITGVQVAGSTSGTVTKSGNTVNPFAAGTDAALIFGGIVDPGGQIQVSAGSSASLTFSGLDPNRTYTLAATANRDRPAGLTFLARTTTFGLTGAGGFTNASSVGTTPNAGGDQVTFFTHDNTVAGYVARWTGIQPGADGELTLTSSADVDAVAEAFGAAAVMLQLESDTTAPVITRLGAAEVTVEGGAGYTDAGATASDVVDGDLTGQIVVGGDSVDTSTVGDYVVTYDVSDAAGNPAAQVTRTVHVVDTTAPVITRLGAAEVTLVVGGSYTDAGATAFDVVDGDLTGQIVVGGDSVDTSTVGDYVVTYDVSDAAGNPAAQRTRTVHVVDTTAPVITRLGAAEVTVEGGAGYTDAGATAFDVVDGDLTGQIVVGGDSVDTSTVGDYVITYDVSDASGNPAVQVTRTVYVVDTTAPLITLLGEAVVALVVGDDYADAGAAASDVVDGDLTGEIVVGGDVVDTSVADTYVVTYDVEDAAGNPAVQVTRTVQVQEPALLTGTPVPTISGTSRVGRTLTAVPGTWEPAPVELGYQWLRNGVEIDGATGATHLLDAADLGQRITVAVTGSRAGFESVVKTSKATATVTAASLSPTPKPVITGTRRVGHTLTAEPGTWGPGSVELTYRWYRSGKRIKGEEAASHVLVAADRGKRISVKVTGTRAGYTTVTRASSKTRKVAAGVLDPTPRPVISGVAAVGLTLTVDIGTWGPEPVKLRIRWLRSGKSIKGATGLTRTLTAADRGKRISVRVTGTKSGYTKVARRSVATGKVLPGTLDPTPAPTIQVDGNPVGTPVVGQKLRAVPGVWGPGSVSFSYRWFRTDCSAVAPVARAISKATKVTYTPTGTDLGQCLSVRVTGRKTGYTTQAQVSPLTVPVDPRP